MEWETALTREIDENKKILLLVLIEKCEIPPFLKRKRYADFTKNYCEELLKLAKAVVKPENTDEKNM